MNTCIQYGMSCNASTSTIQINSIQFHPIPNHFCIAPWSQLIWNCHETFVLLRTPHVRNHAASRAHHITCDQNMSHKSYCVTMYHQFSSCIALKRWTWFFKYSTVSNLYNAWIDACGILCDNFPLIMRTTHLIHLNLSPRQTQRKPLARQREVLLFLSCTKVWRNNIQREACHVSI